VRFQRGALEGKGRQFDGHGGLLSGKGGAFAAA
jgi:hypothetical protein